MTLYKLIWRFLLVLTIISCSDDDVTNSPTNNFTDENQDPYDENHDIPDLVIRQELRPFYDNFIEEMNTRGLDLGDIPINLDFSNSLPQGYCGRGYFDQNINAARVEIVPDCWGDRPYIEKEGLMFHELGHALLGRGHTFGSLPNGSRKSIMCTGPTCSPFTTYNIHQTQQRSYYLDELINEDIAVPDWASAKIYSGLLQHDSFTETEDWENGVLTLTGNENSFDYFISNSEYTSPPYALGITTVDSDNVLFGNWYKDFFFSDLEDCANIVATANFKSSGIQVNGFISLIIDLYDSQESEIEFSRIYADTFSEQDSNGFISISTTAICIPDETVKIRVRFFVKSQSNSTVYIDDLSIYLYE